MAAPFAEKAVGTVACIYKGLPVHGPVASFGLHINDRVVPSVLLDVGLRGIDFVFGAMTGVRRQALDGIGGFEPLSQGVAEGFGMAHCAQWSESGAFALRLRDRGGRAAISLRFSCVR